MGHLNFDRLTTSVDNIDPLLFIISKRHGYVNQLNKKQFKFKKNGKSGTVSLSIRKYN